MDQLLKMVDLDVRIAAIRSLRSQVEAKLMQDSGVKYFDDERIYRALTDALIELRALQIDGTLPDRVRRPA